MKPRPFEMFGAADLPLFSGTPQAAKIEKFDPQPMDGRQLTFEAWMKLVNEAEAGY